MRANPIYRTDDLEFWSVVKFLGQKVGYSNLGLFVVPTPAQIVTAFQDAGLSSARLVTPPNTLTPEGQHVVNYFTERANMLNNQCAPNLMNAAQAKALFTAQFAQINPPSAILKMNKQTGAKKDFSFLTCLINMHVWANLQGTNVNLDPYELTSFTQNSFPARTLSRRVDGCYPSTVNPKAVWEVKEYYYTTTFGSRIADGVYETLLDGYELLEVRNSLGRDVRHILFIDAVETWWDKGKSYLCRMVDMLHMGAVNEIVIGREVVTRVPALMAQWRAMP